MYMCALYFKDFITATYCQPLGLGSHQPEDLGIGTVADSLL